MPENEKNLQKIKNVLVHSIEQAKPMLKRLHPSDIAKILEDVSPEARMTILSLLPPEIASEALIEMDEDSNPSEILTQFSPEQAANIIEELDPDDAADLLAALPLQDIRLIFSRLGEEVSTTLTKLMSYDEDSAGGIMNPDVFKIPAYWTKREALREVIRVSEEMEDFYVIYVVDDRDHLLGVVSLKDLIRAAPSTKVFNLTQDNIIKADVGDDQEEVAKLMQKYNLPAIPVVDGDNVLCGRITFDDVMDVLEEESTEDMLRMAGVSDDEALRGSWLAAVRSRIPWLLINLLTAGFAGFVISLFEETIENMAVIAVFMPVIAGVAGNGATQTLAVTIRRIATDGVASKEYMEVIFKELLVGITNGLLLGTVVGLTAFLLNANPMLGLVVFFALVGNLMVAGLAGSAVPLFLQRLGVDPAVASSILITAFTDILGYVLLFSLGTAMLL